MEAHEAGRIWCRQPCSSEWEVNESAFVYSMVVLPVPTQFSGESVGSEYAQVLMEAKCPSAAKRLREAVSFLFAVTTLVLCFHLFLCDNMITLFLPSFSSPLSPFFLSFKCMAFCFKVVCYMPTYIWLYIYVPEYDLLSLKNITYLYVFRVRIYAWLLSWTGRVCPS